jgi:2,4-dienoyl-CoA reductase-like NADH-dependent reductase (Old Yellow Enzyme family)
MIIDPESPFEGARFDGFTHVAEAAKANGSLIIGQISHVGRKVTLDLVKEAISASAIPINNNGAKRFSPVRSASKEDIALITTGFAHAAEYLDKAGFDGVELHAAHGYLLAQFLSPTTNRRNDAYGGSLSNRMRLLVEVVQEIQRRTSPGFIIGVKLNSVEFQDGGFTLADARELCRVLQDDLRLDFLELSGGSAEGLATPAAKETTREREAFFLEFAEAIIPAMNDASIVQRKKTKNVLTGGLRSASGINKAIEVVDAVGIGRPATQKPSAPTEMLQKNVEILPTAVPPFDNNIGLGVLASQAQMKDICRGIEPFDLTNSEVAAQFLTEIQVKST